MTTLKTFALGVAWASVSLLGAHAREQARDAAVAPTTIRDSEISGVLSSDDADTKPIARAFVTATSAALPDGRFAITDEQGHFTLTSLPAGDYTLSAAKPTYVTSYYGSRRPGHGPGTAVALDAHQHVTVPLTMVRGGVIAGTVLDERGRPRPDALVSIIDVRGSGANRRLALVVHRTTDDLGAYRAYGLPPGTFVVAVASQFSLGGEVVPTPADVAAALAGTPFVARHAQGYAPIFFPNVTDPDQATPITLAAGEVRDGVDLSLRFVPTTRIEGRVVNAAGQVPANIQMAVTSTTQQWGVPLPPGVPGSIRQNGAVVTQDGRFWSAGMAPGHYTFFARAADTVGASAAPSGRVPTLALWGLADVDIREEDVTHLQITMTPGMTVAGTVSTDERTGPADLGRVALRLRPIQTAGLNLDTAAAQVAPSGDFSFSGVPPGRYLIDLAAGGNFSLVSAVIGSVDVADLPMTIAPGTNISGINVHLTGHSAALSGSLTDELGRPAISYAIVVCPTDHSLWTEGSRRVRLVAPTTNGDYVVPNLPVGEYFVAAVTIAEASDLVDPDFLNAIAASAIKVSITIGQQKILNLRLGSGG